MSDGPVLLSSTRLLQTNALRDQVRRDQVELDRSKTRLDNARTDALLQELQEANVKVATTTARLRAVGEKLLYTTALKSQLNSGKGTGASIRRHEENGKHVGEDEGRRGI